MKTFLNGWKIVLALIFNGKIKISFRKLLKRSPVFEVMLCAFISK